MIKFAVKSSFVIAAAFCMVALISFSSFRVGFWPIAEKDAHKTDSLLYLLSLENHSLGRMLPENYQQSAGQEIFQLLTNINLKDMKTFLISEIPGMTRFGSDILVAGQGTDFTNLPIETPPPDVMEPGEKEAEPPSNSKPPSPAPQTTDNVAFIYHTHNLESFLPLLSGQKDPNKAISRDKNVTLLGKRLGEKLNEKGIKTLVDTTDINSQLVKRKLNYYKSYAVSREVVQEAMQRNKEVQLLFDIHRDSRPRKSTTATINGISYAKPYFVIGKSNPKYESNLEYSKKLHYAIEKEYPGLSRGVFGKTKKEGDGVYNQDLSSRSVVIEIGGYENTLEELYRTVDILAEVISDYYWGEAVEASGKE